MNRIQGFFAFWYDFIVGDDWVLAVGVVALLAIAAALARSEVAPLAWLVMPLGVVLILVISLRDVLKAR
jgi:hypothetical protein